MAGPRITGPDIGRIMSNVGSSIHRGSLKTLMAAALAAKAIQIGEIRRATGGDMRLSGVGRARGRPGNAKVGVRFDIKPGEIPSAFFKATGPLHIVENDMGGHVITSAYLRGAGRKYSGRKSAIQGPGLMGTQFRGDRRAVLNIPGIPGNFRRSARHPGTKGKKPWATGREKARKPVARIMRKRTFDIVRQAAKP